MKSRSAVQATRWLLVGFNVVAAAACLVMINELARLYRAHRLRVGGVDKVFVASGGEYYTNDAMPFERFPRVKARDEYRVFLVGSSQAMGTPYVTQGRNLLKTLLGANKGGVATWLEDYLQVLHADRRVRVVNATVASRELEYCVDVVRAALKEGAADAVFVMAKLEPNREHWLSDRAGESRAAERYRGLVRVVAEAAEKSRTPVFLVTCPVNLRDMPPAGYEPFRDGPAVSLMERGEYREALDLLRPREPSGSALRLWHIARCYDRLGEFPAARRFYLLARDNDYRTDRGRSAWNKIVAGVNGRYAKAIDLEAELFLHAQDGIPGKDLFLDAVHMSLETNRLAAGIVAEKYAGLAGLPPAAREAARRHRPRPCLELKAPVLGWVVIPR
ncbi:MAG: hypothetical protein HY927_11780 [Elusimicrobia bacterium]|nr:hypothetical protein [Elusimicrobiota bacterium]